MARSLVLRSYESTGRLSAISSRGVCGDPSFPAFMLDRRVVDDLDHIRAEALAAFHEAYNRFDVQLNWRSTSTEGVRLSILRF